jgi:hypothetical protein
VGELASLYDTANEDMPTTVRMPPSEERSGPVQLTPLAGARSFGPAVTAPVPVAKRGPLASLPDRERNLVIVGGLLALAMATGALIAFATRHKPTMESAAPAGTQAMVTLRFVGIPPNARLVVGGTPIYNSDTAVLPRMHQATAVEVTAPGFQGVRFTLVPDRDQTIPLILQPNAPGVPQAPSPAPVPIAEPTRAAGSAAAPAPRASGYLTVRAGTPCTLAIDREPRGRTPLVRFSVAPGPHQVICRTATGALRSRNVSVNAGQETVVSFSP